MDRGTWCILRTRGSQTIPLAQALSTQFAAWTPVETIRLRLPRRKAKAERTQPIMPTYVFADAAHLPRLVEMSQVDGRIGPDFSVMRHNGRFPLIAADELAHLRTPNKARQRFQTPSRCPVPGEPVSFAGGAFAGLTGAIHAVKGRHVLVAFPGFAIPVEFSAQSCILARI